MILHQLAFRLLRRVALASLIQEEIILMRCFFYRQSVYILLLFMLMLVGCSTNEFESSAKKYQVDVDGTVSKLWPSLAPSELSAMVRKAGADDYNEATACRLALSGNKVIEKKSLSMSFIHDAFIDEMLSDETALVYCYHDYTIDGKRRHLPTNYLIRNLASGTSKDITPDNIEDYLSLFTGGSRPVAWYDSQHGLYLLFSTDVDGIYLLSGKKQIKLIRKWKPPCSIGRLFIDGKLVSAVLDDAGRLFAYSYTTGQLAETSGYEIMCEQLDLERKYLASNHEKYSFCLARNVALIGISGGFAIIGPEGERGRIIRHLRGDGSVKKRLRPGVLYMLTGPDSQAMPFNESQIGVLDSQSKLFYVFE